MGQDAGVCRLMRPYVLVSLPGLFLDIVDRPMNRMPTAQGISLPQMFISGIGAGCKLALLLCLLHAASRCFWLHRVQRCLAALQHHKPRTLHAGS
jgi:hypothetical protein